MPELPDLQVFSRNLTKVLTGKKVRRITVHKVKKLNVSAKKLKDTLVQQVIKKVSREGKELHIVFKDGNVLGLHLMLRGQLSFFTDKAAARFPILSILFTDNTGLTMSDYQGQAAPTLNPDKRLTPDALSRELTFTVLKEKLQRSKAAIKNVLLDQHVVRGIGNAYADEILWDARISPFAVSNRIPDQYIKALLRSIKNVLNNATKNILKTHPDIIGGEVRDFLLIHNAKKKHSPSGAPILVKKTGARKTYYTSEQKEF